LQDHQRLFQECTTAHTGTIYIAWLEINGAIQVLALICTSKVIVATLLTVAARIGPHHPCAEIFRGINQHAGLQWETPATISHKNPVQAGSRAT